MGGCTEEEHHIRSEVLVENSLMKQPVCHFEGQQEPTRRYTELCRVLPQSSIKQIRAKDSKHLRRSRACSDFSHDLPRRTRGTIPRQRKAALQPSTPSCRKTPRCSGRGWQRGSIAGRCCSPTDPPTLRGSCGARVSCGQRPPGAAAGLRAPRAAGGAGAGAGAVRGAGGVPAVRGRAAASGGSARGRSGEEVSTEPGAAGPRVALHRWAAPAGERSPARSCRGAAMGRCLLENVSGAGRRGWVRGRGELPREGRDTESSPGLPGTG